MARAQGAPWVYPLLYRCVCGRPTTRIIWGLCRGSKTRSRSGTRGLRAGSGRGASNRNPCTSGGGEEGDDACPGQGAQARREPTQADPMHDSKTPILQQATPTGQAGAFRDSHNSFRPTLYPMVVLSRERRDSRKWWYLRDR